MKLVLLAVCLALSFIGSWAQSVTGSVVDAKTGRPLPGCSVRVGSQGTITNEDGKFSLKLPGASVAKTSITFSNLGYASKVVPYTGLSKLTIALNQSTTALNEVVVHSSARGIVRSAIDRIPANYPTKSFMMQGMLREYNRVSKTDYLYLLEAQLNAHIKPYTSNDEPKVEVLQKRKQVFRNLDSTLFIHWRNTAYVMDIGDFVHNKPAFLDKKKMANYAYELLDVTSLDGQTVYVIGFSHKADKAKQRGKLFIDAQSMAFVGGEYSAPVKPDKTGAEAVDDTSERSTKTYYQPSGGKWYLRNTTISRTSNLMSRHSEILVEFFSTGIDTTTVQSIGYARNMQKLDILLHKPIAYDSLFWAQQPGTVRNDDLEAFLLQRDTSAVVAPSTNALQKAAIPPAKLPAPLVKVLTYIVRHVHGGYGLSTLPGLVNGGTVGIARDNSAQFSIDQQRSISVLHSYGIYLSQRLDLPYRFSIYNQNSTNFGLGGISNRANLLGLSHTIVMNRQHRPIRFLPFIGVESVRLARSFDDIVAYPDYLGSIRLRGDAVEPILEKRYRNLAYSLQTSIELKRHRKLTIGLTYRVPLHESDRLYLKETGGLPLFRRKREINNQDNQRAFINSSLSIITYQIGLSF
ncbi:carboxypeptidase-like regulatory domain-containing protein [Spirosoma fluviale]|uniref:CarboxypepD_reg-like domain-containing protein n=1 Tax=Spirosoma fluviale TaxID=1597977 RepID=A0A286FHA8_9BACT|nr:carboxypeptidase-like regulatory domain-containing protein [Spirosoma fluviale]SOD82627.1 CarboxypepD_reg-like domain-containing protein [Spirosoma fluviale]